MEDCKHQYYWALRIIRPRPCRNQPPPQQQGLSTRSLWSESRVVPEQNSTDTTAAMTAATTTMAPTPTLTPTHYNSSTANPVVDVLQSSVARTELTVTGYLMISAFLVVLALCLMVIVGSLWHRYKNNNPPIVSSSSGRQRRRRQRQWLWRLQPNDNDTNNNNTESEQQQQQHQRHQQYQAHQKQRIQRRYETIEHWIISKRVQTHNAFCAGVVANFNHHHHHPDTNTNHPCETEEKEEDVERAWPDAPRNDVPQLQEEENAEHHYKNDDEEEDTPECPICMLELLPGEIVSWSANEQCCHGQYNNECNKRTKHTLSIYMHSRRHFFFPLFASVSS